MTVWVMSFLGSVGGSLYYQWLVGEPTTDAEFNRRRRNRALAICLATFGIPLLLLLLLASVL